MHEHGRINDWMRRIGRAAEAENAERVVAVSIWLGALSHMSWEHFHWASAGSMAEGARLDIAGSDDIHDAATADGLLKRIEVETERG